MATIGFFALAVFGLGALSVVTDRDIIDVPGLGQIPGVSGMVAAVVVFALALWATVRRGTASFGSAPVIGLLTALVHLAVVWVAVLVATSDLAVATAVAGDLVRGGASLVILAAAAVAAWGGIALRRTKGERPRWPWERDEDG